MTAARFFNLVRPPIIIIETGQFAEYTYTGSCVLYRGSYTRVILCVYRSRSSSPELLESISLCNFWPPRAHLHTEIGLYTHLHTHIYIYTHTDWNFTLPDKRFTTGKLASTCNAMQWPALHISKRKKLVMFSAGGVVQAFSGHIS